MNYVMRISTEWVHTATLKTRRNAWLSQVRSSLLGPITRIGISHGQRSLLEAFGNMRTKVGRKFHRLYCPLWLKITAQNVFFLNGPLGPETRGLFHQSDLWAPPTFRFQIEAASFFTYDWCLNIADKLAILKSLHACAWVARFKFVLIGEMCQEEIFSCCKVQLACCKFIEMGPWNPYQLELLNDILKNTGITN